MTLSGGRARRLLLLRRLKRRCAHRNSQCACFGRRILSVVDPGDHGELEVEVVVVAVAVVECMQFATKGGAARQRDFSGEAVVLDSCRGDGDRCRDGAIGERGKMRKESDGPE
jgi:hypothetical protein